MTMTCENVRDNLWGYHHHEIPDELNVFVHRHLESCGACAAELERFRQVDAALEAFTAIEPSPYFDRKLNAKLDEAERSSSSWGWAALWLRDRYLWTFAMLFLVVTGLWLGFRHRQDESLTSMEDVVRVQDENLRPGRNPDPNTSPSPPASGEVAAIRVQPQTPSDRDDAISDEDLAVVENLELLQDYDFLKDLADASNGGDVRTN